MKIQHVPLEFVNQVWPMVEPHLEAPEKRRKTKPDYSIDQVRLMVTSGRWLLIVAAENDTIHGAATVDFYNRPNHRVAFITRIGGKLITGNAEFSQFKALLISHGATYVEGAVDEPVARLCKKFGLEETHRIIGATLWTAASNQPVKP